MNDVTTVEANGLAFGCIRAGTGRPALLLHGFPDTPYSFARQVEVLGDAGFSAFAPALRGYPPTLGKGPFDVATLEADAVSLLEAIGASAQNRALLVGHDWGGIIACAVAASHPELIDAAVIISVPHPMVMGAKLLGGDFDQIRRSWYMFLFQMQGLAEAIVSANDYAFLERLMIEWSPNLIENEGHAEIERRKTALAEPGVLTAALGYYRAMLDPSQPVAVGPVGVKSLVVFGEEDGCIPASICDGMEPLFSAGYTLEVVAGAGHFVPSEAPGTLTRLILEFVADRG